MDFRVRPGEIQEDQVTALLERYSAKWPTSLFMGAAIASIIASLVLKRQRKHQDALFVGQWVAPVRIGGLERAGREAARLLGSGVDPYFY